MPASPKGNPPAQARRDRTSAVVAAGLVVLAVLGVVTIFSEPLMALVAPPAPDHAAPPEPGRLPPQTGSDGGASPTAPPAILDPKDRQE